MTGAAPPLSVETGAALAPNATVVRTGAGARSHGVVSEQLLVFVGLLGVLALVRVLVAHTGHIPMGHDTFQYLQLQYTVFNEAVQTGHVPLWLPFMTHGTVSGVWVLISQGLLASVAYLLAPRLSGLNVVDLFHAGLLVDEAFLLVGCVLLAGRWYRSTAAIIFVSASVSFTALATTQVWWNFHLYYLLPLVLYCLDRAIRDCSTRYLFLATLFGAASILGNLPYFVPVTAFCVTAFALWLVVLEPRCALTLASRIRRRVSWRHVVAILVPAAMALGTLLFMTYDSTDAVRYATPGRDAAGKVESLDAFIAYGGSLSIWKYFTLIGRYTNNLDNSVYVGFLTVPFALAATVAGRTRARHAFGLTALTLGLLSAATFVSVGFYYFFPLGNLFRHIGLLTPLVGLFLAFYAGFGFDACWTAEREWRRLTCVALCSVAISAALIGVHLSGALPIFEFNAWAGVPTANQWLLSPEANRMALTLVLVLCTACGIVLLLAVSRVRWAAPALSLLLCIHLLDTASFKLEYELRRAPPSPADVRSLFDPQAYSYPDRRTQDYARNPRFKTLAPMLFEDPDSVVPDAPHRAAGAYGVLYWNTESFTFQDPVASIFRIDHRLRWVDDFHRVWATGGTPSSTPMGFPLPDAVAFWKLVGATEPKIQLFTHFRALDTDDAVAAFLRANSETGNAVGVVRAELPPAANMLALPGSGTRQEQQADDRLAASPPTVEHFSFDEIRIRVSVPNNEPAVLYYADAWHPLWQSWVNGVAVPVIRANLGYKAVVVPAGESVVEFRFGDLWVKLFAFATVLTGILACLGGLALVGDLTRRQDGSGAKR